MSACRLCGQPFEPGETPIRPGPIAANLADPLFRFAGAELHVRCLETDPLGAAVRERTGQRLKRTGPGRRFCAACGEVAGTGADILDLPFLTADLRDPLEPWSFALLHRACLGFPGQAELTGRLRALRDSPEWDGPGLDGAIAALEAGARFPARPGPASGG